MRRLLWRANLRDPQRLRLQLFRVLHRHLRRQVACTDVAVASAAAVASGAPLAASGATPVPSGSALASGGELHCLPHHLRSQDMRQLLWTANLRDPQCLQLHLLRVLHRRRRRQVACADVAAAPAAAVAPATAVTSGFAQPASAPSKRRREHNHSNSGAVAATAVAVAAAAQSAAALAAAAVALAAVGGVAFADRTAALDRLLFRQRSGLSGRGGYDCIGRQVPAVEQPGPEHPHPVRGGQPQLLPQP